MSTITFTSSIKNGVIEIPEEYRQKIGDLGPVEVTIINKKETAKTGIIAELIENPIIVDEFQPLTREEAHERQS